MSTDTARGTLAVALNLHRSQAEAVDRLTARLVAHTTNGDEVRAVAALSLITHLEGEIRNVTAIIGDLILDILADEDGAEV